MKAETWICDKCDDSTSKGDGWLSVRWYGFEGGTIELCPSCFQDFRKWVKQ